MKNTELRHFREWNYCEMKTEPADKYKNKRQDEISLRRSLFSYGQVASYVKTLRKKKMKIQKVRRGAIFKSV